jgi:very-short-patch-repair endonuclease
VVESVERTLALLGGVATRRVLLDAGASPHALRRAVLSETVCGVRQGWYALPDAASDVVSAVRVGGWLTSVSVSRRYSLWALQDGLLHVSVAPNASRLRSPHHRRQALDPAAHGVCLHWRRPRTAAHLTIAPPVAALIDAIECQSEECAIAMMDSALNQGRVTLAQLRAAARGLPDRYLHAIGCCDPLSQSGTESLVRVRLRRRGVRVQTQFRRQGVGRVDLLIGDRLVIECDSQEFHSGDEAQERDYDRDLALIDGDFLVLRLRYRHVVYEWERVESIILGLIRRGRHLNPRHR